jgi:ABC-type transport system involved in multi-copper enzyme maturation permease subunit
MGLPGNRYRAQRMMSQSLNYLKNVNVTVIATDNPNHLKYHVTSEGTKALDRESWRHTPSILNIYDFPLFTMSLREGVFLFQNYVIGGFGAWIVLLISVIVTAGFVPNMMQKGTVDLYIAKPIGRAQLLIYKYFGGLTFFFIIISFLIFFTWLIYALRYGFWNPQLLLAIPLMTFYFGILYAISVLFATLTRSTIATILMVIVAWICIFVIGKANNSVEERLWQIDHPKKLEDLIQVKDGEKPEIDPDQIAGSINPDAPLFLGLLPRPTWPVVQAIHKITPRTYQLDNRLSEVIAQGVLSPSQLEKKQERPQSASWFEVIAVNVVFITLVLCLACWRFQRRDG